MRHRAFVVVAVVALSASVLAQAPAERPAFEAASIRRSKAADVGIGGGAGGSTEFRVTNIPLRVLIRNAYGLRQPAELSDGPAWLDSDRFDVVGKMSRPAPYSQTMAMVRTLLADRFKFVAHKESRELPIYTLVVARSDGRLGPNMHASTCVAGRTPQDNGCFFRPGLGSFVAAGVPVQMLIDASLTSEVQRTVVNRTTLTGTFDIDLHWLPDNPALGPHPDGPVPDQSGTSIFTALQDQLGLKLESTRGPVEVLVIDHIEKPTED